MLHFKITNNLQYYKKLLRTRTRVARLGLWVVIQLEGIFDRSRIRRISEYLTSEYERGKYCGWIRETCTACAASWRRWLTEFLMDLMGPSVSRDRYWATGSSWSDGVDYIPDSIHYSAWCSTVQYGTALRHLIPTGKCVCKWDETL